MSPCYLPLGTSCVNCSKVIFKQSVQIHWEEKQQFKFTRQGIFEKVFLILCNYKMYFPPLCLPTTGC